MRRHLQPSIFDLKRLSASTVELAARLRDDGFLRYAAEGRKRKKRHGHLTGDGPSTPKKKASSLCNARLDVFFAPFCDPPSTAIRSELGRKSQRGKTNVRKRRFAGTHRGMLSANRSPPSLCPPPFTKWENDSLISSLQ